MFRKYKSKTFIKIRELQNDVQSHSRIATCEALWEIPVSHTKAGYFLGHTGMSHKKACYFLGHTGMSQNRRDARTNRYVP
jgi:hypothetical protein